MLGGSIFWLGLFVRRKYHTCWLYVFSRNIWFEVLLLLWNVWVSKSEPETCIYVYEFGCGSHAGICGLYTWAWIHHEPSSLTQNRPLSGCVGYNLKNALSKYTLPSNGRWVWPKPKGIWNPISNSYFPFNKETNSCHGMAERTLDVKSQFLPLKEYKMNQLSVSTVHGSHKL